MKVTPGVRPEWAASGDQKRIMTPQEAIKAGADYLVISGLLQSRRQKSARPSMPQRKLQKKSPVFCRKEMLMIQITEEKVLKVLRDCNAVITDSHIVYTSGKHGSAYVNKDAVYPHTKITSWLCEAFAWQFAKQGIEAVIGPEKRGIILAQWTAHHLSCPRIREVLAVYAEKADDGESFVIKRGYDKLISGKKVLVVEDVLTTGGSAKKVVEAVRAIGGKVAGLAVLCNRGGITPKDVGEVPKLFALVNLKLDSWEEDSCHLCDTGVPLNLDVGKGREFLERKKDTYLICPNAKCRGLAYWIDKRAGTFTCPRCAPNEIRKNNQ